jgi:large subunit ribosomal protein L13
MTTYMAKAETITRQWYLIDAEEKVLGRLASHVAARLRGKHKPEYTPHADTGDFFVIINADKLRVTGKKQQDKLYHRHTGYPGGLKTQNFAEMQEKHPGRALEIAIKGMLPKGPLGRQMFRKLKVYAGGEHPHVGQQPIDVTAELNEDK